LEAITQEVVIMIVFLMCRALDVGELTFVEESVQDAHLNAEFGDVYAESSCVIKSRLISVRISGTMFESIGAVIVSKVSIKDPSLLTVGSVRLAYSTSPRSAKVTKRRIVRGALRRLVGLKGLVHLVDAIGIVVVTVSIPPSFRSILGEGLRSQLYRYPMTTAAFSYIHVGHLQTDGPIILVVHPAEDTSSICPSELDE
jgi:hypothetical protein